MLPSISFFDLWSPGLLFVIVIICGLYLKATSSWRSRFAESSQVPLKKKILFFSGMFFIYLADGSPITYYGHHFIFSAHMIQQAVLYFIVPPLVLSGVPVYLFKALFQIRIMKRILITNPIFATVFFNGIFSLYHYPLVFDAVMDYAVVMFVAHTLLLISAFQLWWHITCPDPEFRRTHGLKKIGYIFISGILLTPACGLIIFAGTPMYTVYAHAPQIFLPTLDDQQLGGILMKLVQEVSYGVGLAIAFFEWYRGENPVDSGVLSNEELVISPTIRGEQPQS